MPDVPIDRTMLQELADLSRLHLPAEREAELLGKLQDIVGAFAALQAVSTSQLPAEQPPRATPLRADADPVTLPRDEVLDNAPQRAADCFVVPRVVDA